MEFDSALRKEMDTDANRLDHFSDYVLGMAGYECSNPRTHAGVIPVANRLLKPRALQGNSVLVLGPGSTFELDEFWRKGATRVVGIDTGVRQYNYSIREGEFRGDHIYPFPTSPSKAEREKRWGAYVERTGLREADLLSAFNLIMRDGNPMPYLSEDSKRQVRECRAKALQATTEEEFYTERDAHLQTRFALLKTPVYIGEDTKLVSKDGIVYYIEGFIEEKLGALDGQFDLITATALFEQGRYGPPEQMTEYKMFVSRRGEGRMVDPSVIPVVMDGIANHLAEKGAVLIKTIYNPTFLQREAFASHGLAAENYNTETPYGYFTILHKPQ